MKSLRHRLLRLLGGILFLLLLEFLLARWMVDQQVVSTILSAGSHVPPLTLALAGLFVAVRFSLIVLLPGSALAQLALLALDWRKAQRDRNQPPAHPSETRLP
jgi:hypothetical protein